MAAKGKRYRDAGDGEFVTEAEAEEHPDTTVSETVDERKATVESDAEDESDAAVNAALLKLRHERGEDVVAVHYDTPMPDLSDEEPDTTLADEHAEPLRVGVEWVPSDDETGEDA